MASTDPVETFWVNESPDTELSLRVFTLSTEQRCPTVEKSGHSASVSLGTHAAIVTADGYLEALREEDYPTGWPTRCNACGELFPPEARRQASQQRICVAADGRSWPARELPPGAMYDAYWNPWKGPDGICLVVVVPPGRPTSLIDHWYVDGPASNCNMPDTEHHCWVREGNPRLEPVTVSKGAPGQSCTVGAGSIGTDAWHGFLRDGRLVTA